MRRFGDNAGVPPDEPRKRRWVLVLLTLPFIAAAVMVSLMLALRPSVDSVAPDPGALLRVRIGLATMVGGALCVAAWIAVRRWRRRP